MNRHCSLFSARVRGKRDKFASTRTSLSESWDQSFCDEDPHVGVPGFPDLPSPTIGTKEISINKVDSQFQLLSQIDSPPPSATERSRTRSSGSEPSPRSSADPAVPISAWKRNAGVQCDLYSQYPQVVKLARPLTEKELGLFHAHRYHPYVRSHLDYGERRGSSKRKQSTTGQKLCSMSRLSRSLDWTEFPEYLHSPLWEPFIGVSNTAPATDSLVRSLGSNVEADVYYLTSSGSSWNYFSPAEKDVSFEYPTGPIVLTQPQTREHIEIVTCDKCLGKASDPQPSNIQTQISNLTSSIVEFEQKSKNEPDVCGSGADIKTTDEFKPLSVSIPTTNTESVAKPSEQDTNKLSKKTGSSRPQIPTLGFTLPIPQLTLTTQGSCNNRTGSGSTCPHKNPPVSISSSSASRSSGPTPAPYYSASVDHGIIGSTGKNSEHLEGRSKSSTLPVIDSRHITAIRNAEKRRKFFATARKQTNSAPDSFDASSFFAVTTHGVINTTRRLCGNCKEPVTNCLDGVLKATRREKADPSIITPSVEVWENEIRTARCGDVAVTHVSELDFPDADPPCHFCCEQASTAIHDESRLQIVSGGLVRSRDGSARSGSGHYINLPSPNVQAENGSQGVAFGSIDLSPSMSQGLSPGTGGNLTTGGCGSSSRGPGPTGGGNGKVEEEDPLVGPPVSSLTRRLALVPPKIMSDPDYENDSERDKSARNSEDGTSPRTRRSSIVVIPPMQICPGDLLVYGKVLSQRKSLLGTTIESPSPVTSMFETDNTPTRKGKASWSLMKLFERSSRTKGTGVGTLEEVMSIIQPCDFSDPKLSRFKGMCWADFASYIARSKNKGTGQQSVQSPGEETEMLLPRITKAINESQNVAPKSTIDTTSTTGTTTGSSTTCETLLVTTTAIATGTAGSNTGGQTSTGESTSYTESFLQSIAKGSKKPEVGSPKPFVRKKMGLMRTMSDRCLERRITPALWRGTPGFLLGEKLVEGKEPEPTSSTPGTKGSKDKNKKQPSTSSGSEQQGTSASSQDSVQNQSSDPIGTESKESISDPDLRQKLRQKEALWDLFQSECSFLYDHLMVLKNVFLEPLKRIQVEGFAMYAEPELLFGNLDELCCVTYGFCKEFIYLLLKLTDSSGELSTTEVLGKLFEPSSKARAMSQAYHRYALNYINALNYLETLRRHNEFGEFEKLCMRDPRCKKLQLTDLLVSPVQHIMKIPLILKDIQSRTNQPQEKELIAQILEIQENSIRELDDKMRWLKNFERLLEIQRNIVWPSILEMEPKTWVPEFLRVALSRQPCDSLVVSPRRQIIHEGLLQLWDTGKPTETYVILFDDMLLITRRKKGLSKKKSSLSENWASTYGKNTGVVGSGLETNHRYIVYRQPISLDRFFIHDIGEAENTTAKLDYAFVLVSLNRFQQIVSVHTFQATSDTVKSTWLRKMKTTQDKWKRTLQNTVFRGVRTSTDSGQSNIASALLTSKSFRREQQS